MKHTLRRRLVALTGLAAIIFTLLIANGGPASATQATNYNGQYYGAVTGGDSQVYFPAGQFDTGTVNMGVTNCGGRLVLQTDGNLVERGRTGNTIWNSGTVGHPLDELVLQADGNAVIYDRNSSGVITSVLWSAGTNYGAQYLYWFGTDNVGHFDIFSNRTPINYAWYPPGTIRAERQYPGGTVNCTIST